MKGSDGPNRIFWVVKNLVNIKVSFSNSSNIMRDISQGSILHPLVFLIYVKEMS